jgi:hypothetical protein
VHVALTVLRVRVGVFGAPPLLAIGSPASSRLWVHLLPIEGAIAHCKIIPGFIHIYWLIAALTQTQTLKVI